VVVLDRRTAENHIVCVVTLVIVVPTVPVLVLAIACQPSHVTVDQVVVVLPMVLVVVEVGAPNVMDKY
jgi:hypothetical protein